MRVAGRSSVFSDMRAQNLNDLPGSSFDLKLRPAITHARDPVNGTAKTNKKQTPNLPKNLWGGGNWRTPEER